MIWTRVWVCGRWTWRLLTFAKWRAMPHIDKKMALIKAAKVSGAILCAGGVGGMIPPLLDTGSRPPVFAGRKLPVTIERKSLVSTPEPWSIAVLAVGVVALARIRR